MTKIGSADLDPDPDPHQTVMDPEHWLKELVPANLVRVHSYKQFLL